MPPWLTSGSVMWIAIVAIVLIGNYFGYKHRESRARLLEKLAEKGQSIPPELLRELRDGEVTNNAFTVSFILMGVGIALAVFFWGITGGNGFFHSTTGAPDWLPVIGVFPFIIGLAKLFGTLADRRRDNK